MEGEDGLPGKALARFPSFFRADDRRVNLSKARDWWHKCEALPQEPDGERQRKYARNDFTDRYDSVYRRLKGKKQVISEKQREIYISAASHLGRLKRQFDAGLGLPDSTSGVSYRTHPTAFINNKVMQQWLEDTRCWGPGGPFVGERTLGVDNTSGHSDEEAQAAAKTLWTCIRFSPPNATDLAQPTDRLSIQRIKEYWRRICAKRNMDAIRRGNWRQGSGALQTQRRSFSSKLLQSACGW
ncbi:DDE superfamily endonuclease domain [Phytophthora cactorum]|nr:DDE superfamily endonuclease domain [Phytophthora cactorum]